MKILILGIGNILFGDEGIGAHFAHYIDEKYSFLPSEGNSITIIDGGTLAHLLIPTIVEYDKVVLIDCIESEDGEFGDVFFFDFEAMPNKISWQGSAHEVETLQTLEMMKVQGDIPSIKIIGVIPTRIESDSTFELSTDIVRAINTMEKVLKRYILELDPQCKITEKQGVDILEIAKISYKREIKQNDF